MITTSGTAAPTIIHSVKNEKVFFILFFSSPPPPFNFLLVTNKLRIENVGGVIAASNEALRWNISCFFFPNVTVCVIVWIAQRQQVECRFVIQTTQMGNASLGFFYSFHSFPKGMKRSKEKQSKCDHRFASSALIIRATSLLPTGHGRYVNGHLLLSWSCCWSSVSGLIVFVAVGYFCVAAVQPAKESTHQIRNWRKYTQSGVTIQKVEIIKEEEKRNNR